jgi:hypothetical protein
MTQEPQPNIEEISFPPMIDKIGIKMVKYPDMERLLEIQAEKEKQVAENERVYKEAQERKKQKALEELNNQNTNED